MKPAAPVITVTLNPALDKTVTIEQFEYGGLNRIKEMRTDAGGKGINVAKVLKLFEVDVNALGLKAGYQGQVIRDQLEKLGIDSTMIEAPGETRVNLKIVDESTKQTTELNEPGFMVDTDLLEQFQAVFKSKAAEASIIVLGGSLSPGIPPNYYRSLIEIARAQGIRTILDADGEALALGIEAAPFAIKPNVHELEALLGETFDSMEQMIAAVRKLIDRGIEYVLVSMGAEGSLLVSKTEAVKASPFPIMPVSTVGAGDSMVAALVYSFLNGKSVEETARWTSAAGTITASKPGTQVCTLHEVMHSLQLVTLTHY
ncbi:tagatose-6-phosphate kinase [Paenibacillus baekrokdamisoli]|uniref:Tagatose-6-phosphate kinase n=1 Tax=Paenibacillus baekrokdamisoli TaxID=1712516 RepID=A0A3G9JGQ3_9BACL|nr:1-phosphofructokinase [Paenibacillus baekrokdamisoli]MBB3071855.1 1-phosphofructokinase [Paenibacillus baekrokdamisoli]BBH24163.1 tagatose-6-phosphate kinase [Paenibacillus baekrokdamisoli]